MSAHKQQPEPTLEQIATAFVEKENELGELYMMKTQVSLERAEQEEYEVLTAANWRKVKNYMLSALEPQLKSTKPFHALLELYFATKELQMRTLDNNEVEHAEEDKTFMEWEQRYSVKTYKPEMQEKDKKEKLPGVYMLFERDVPFPSFVVVHKQVLLECKKEEAPKPATKSAVAPKHQQLCSSNNDGNNGANDQSCMSPLKDENFRGDEWVLTPNTIEQVVQHVEQMPADGDQDAVRQNLQGRFNGVGTGGVLDTNRMNEQQSAQKRDSLLLELLNLRVVVDLPWLRTSRYCNWLRWEPEDSVRKWADEHGVKIWMLAEAFSVFRTDESIKIPSWLDPQNEGSTKRRKTSKGNGGTPQRSSFAKRDDYLNAISKKEETTANV